MNMELSSPALMLHSPGVSIKEESLQVKHPVLPVLNKTLISIIF